MSYMYVILGLGIREKSDEVSQHRSLSYIFHCSLSMPYQVLTAQSRGMAKRE